MMPIASPPRGLRRLIAATVVLSVATTLGPSLAAAVTACPGGNVTLATINGSSDPIGVDDDLQVQLNGSVIFENNDEIATNLPPIPFTAAYGDVLRIIASNSTVYGGHAYVASLVVYCDANGASQVLQSTQIGRAHV